MFVLPVTEMFWQLANRRNSICPRAQATPLSLHCVHGSGDQGWWWRKLSGPTALEAEWTRHKNEVGPLVWLCCCLVFFRLRKAVRRCRSLVRPAYIKSPPCHVVVFFCVFRFYVREKERERE